MKKEILIVPLLLSLLSSANSFAQSYQHQLYECESTEKELSTPKDRKKFVLDSITSSDQEYLGLKIQISSHALPLINENVVLDATSRRYSELNPFGWGYDVYVGVSDFYDVALVSPRLDGVEKGSIGELFIMDASGNIHSKQFVTCEKTEETYETKEYGFDK